MVDAQDMQLILRTLVVEAVRRYEPNICGRSVFFHVDFASVDDSARK